MASNQESNNFPYRSDDELQKFTIGELNLIMHLLPLLNTIHDGLNFLKGKLNGFVLNLAIRCCS